MAYLVETHDWASVDDGNQGRKHLQAEICQLARLYLHPLPCYQVFDESSTGSRNDKIIITAREDGTLRGFTSALYLSVAGMESPILHTGITVIHEQHRRASVKKLLFARLFTHVLQSFPRGIWLSSLAEVITSLVHVGKYVGDVYPSPSWEAAHGKHSPSDQHLRIARAIDRNYRPIMNISPAAGFDEHEFVFRGSNDWCGGRAFMKDVADVTNKHQDHQATLFFERLFRPNAGDEVLQIGFLTVGMLMAAAGAEEAAVQKIATTRLSKL
ncbi:hypothetical protein BKA67DRAFT_558396 [Truncatella angustata]|uniref:Uncharacterized protein n=1 Tax=Truncatella angustata TaxID=152316 RepID=A0A9P8UU43_9PEZI|nr:uncharacterized protein BKA67DRAFT_558396 [Truncatella angustata]KAH6658542.1 hypothetical protein BKA67DRAFT_558396 [Truncatella angustata]